MKQLLSLLFASLTAVATATAQTEVIDISGNNTSSSYISYDKAISLPSSKTVEVKMARYCYFSSTISGSGRLNLYAGGERSYLGTAKGAAWPNWTNYKGDIHIYPFKENSLSAGFYGVVLAHGGKSSSPDNALDDAKSGKVNPSMANNKVTLHAGATICCEANTSGAGFRIGELQTEAGSKLQGYMKTDRAAYYLLGGLNTDATLAGTIAPSNYNDNTALGLVKEGKGTYRITGNDNYLSGALRVLEGRVLVMNDRAEAEKKKLRGALGARPNVNNAVAYVFSGGVLGGTGSIGGTVDNYGTIEPGDDKPGTLTLRNYVTPSKNANLIVHPASVLRFKIASADSCDHLDVSGAVNLDTRMEDFSTSDKLPVVELVIDSQAVLNVGDTFTLLTAKSKGDNVAFRLQQPGTGSWTIEETMDSEDYKVLEEQARNYRVVTDIVLNNDNCPHMLVWGVKDNDSWRSASNPLLYNSGLSKKPAWYAVRSALRHRSIVTSAMPVHDRPTTDDGAVYDLHGRRVTTPLRPGLYVRGGRKFVVTR